MLVLGRNKNQTIVIDTPSGRIVLTVLRGNNVRLGFDADRSIAHIYRGELDRAHDVAQTATNAGAECRQR